MRTPRWNTLVVLCVVTACRPETSVWELAPGPDHFNAWQDPAAYESNFANLDGITLHYLDWGGSGEVLLFLAGGGATAYIMGGLADRFKESHRVLALTRRGTGESDHPDEGYTIDDHASDIVMFLDEVGIDRATLVGHSMAGGEMTRVAELYPSRVQRLVYLDATNDYEGYAEMIEANPHPHPTFPEFGVPASASLRDYRRVHVFGFWSNSLEANARAFRRAPHPELQSAFIEDATRNPNNYAGVSAPALAFLALAGFKEWDPGQEATASPEVRAEAEEYFETFRLPWQRSAADRFRREMRNGRMIELRANHTFFIPLEDLVVEEMRAFFAETPR